MASKRKGQAPAQHRIFRWIDEQDPEFAAVFNDLSLKRALTPAVGEGLTFLYPKERAYRAEIIRVADTDPGKASEMINSLIVPDRLTQSGDFTQQPIGSRLGVKYDVADASRGRVRLASGAELAPVGGTSFPSRGDGLAVWLITEGRLPLEGAAYAPPRRAARAAARIKQGGASSILTSRAVKAAEIEDLYIKALKKGMSHADNPYLAAVTSLLNYLKKYYSSLFYAVIVLIDASPVVTFYLLLQPYKSKGPYILPDDVLFGENKWNWVLTIYADAASEYIDFLSTEKKDPLVQEMFQVGNKVPQIYTQSEAVRTQIDGIRTAHQQTDCGAMVRTISEFYATLVERNTIGDIPDVFPTATLELLAPFGGTMKAWQDVFRFIAGNALAKALGAGDPQSKANEFNEVLLYIRSEEGNGNNYALQLCNSKDSKYPMDFKTTEMLVAKFLESGDLGYFPKPCEVLVVGAGEDFEEDDVYGRNREAERDLRASSARMTNPAGISPGALLELRMYVETHKKLPAAVTALVE